MANLDLATLNVRIQADGSQAVSEIERVGGASRTQSNNVSTDWASVGKTLTSLGTKLSLAISTPIIAAGTACVKLASDLTETLGKTEVVFGSMADTVISWSETSVESMGLAQQTALDMASTYGDLGTSMGLTTEEAASMSMNLTQLAADMASFKNISVERANVALQAVYTGETESLKAMGIVMTEANLQQFAIAEGCEKTYSAMSQTEKVMLRYKYVMAMTTNAQGDFVRTGDSLANQSRKLGENIKQLGASFGSILEPAVTSVIKTINNVVTWLNNLSEGTKKVITVVAEVLAAIPLVITAVGGIITIVNSLHTTLTMLMANPVTAAIVGVTAALTALGIILANVASEANYSEQEYEKFKASLDEQVKAKVDTSEIDNLEDKEIDIEVNASVTTSEDFYTTIDGLISKTEELKGDCVAIGKFEIAEGTDEVINEYIQGLAEATIAVENFDDQVSNLDAIADRMAAEQKATVVTQMLAQSQQLYAAYMAGTITESQYTQYMAEVAASAQGAISSIDANTEAVKKNNAAFADGKVDTVNWGATYAASLGMASGASENLTISSEQAAASIQALSTGQGTAADAGIAWAAIQQENAAAALAAANAEQTYQAAIAQANSDMETTITYQQESAALAGNLASAYELIGGAMSGGATASEALNTALQSYPELAALLIEQTNGAVTVLQGDELASTAAATGNLQLQQAALVLNKEMEAGVAPNQALQDILLKYPDLTSEIVNTFTTTGDTAAVTFDGILTLQTEAEAAQKESLAAIEQAKTDYQSQTQAAEEAYTSSMSAITTTYTAEEVAAIGKMCQDAGIELSDAEIEAQTTTTAMMTGMATAVASGAPETVNEVHECCDNMISETDGLEDGGSDAGKNLIAGMISGINSKEGSLYTKVRQVVNKAIQAAKNAGEIKSPSRKTKRLVGKPLMEGIEAGMNDYLPKVLETTKKNTNAIITAGTSTINSDYKLRPVNTTNIARQGNTVINQTNNFTSRTLSPYEQQKQIRQLNKDLSGVFA